MTFERSPSTTPPPNSTSTSWRPGTVRLDRAEKVEDWGVTSIVFAPVLRALAECGLPTPTGGDLGRAPGTEANAVLDAAASTLGDETIGLRVAERVPVCALGTLDYAFAASSGLRDALRRLMAFYPLLSERVTVVLIEEPTRTVVAFRRKAGVTQSRHWVELTLGMVFMRIRHALGESAMLDEVRFCHEPPARMDDHERFFQAKVLFSQEDDALVVPRSIQDTPFRTAAPSLARVLDGELAASLRERLGPLGGDDPFVGRVRMTIAAALESGESSIELVAARLQLSSRTLQRLLQRRGTSHSAIVDELRRERAIYLVTNERLTGNEVAKRLGFSEPGAFFRAFRRWTGTSPVAFRREHRSAEAAREL